MNLLPMLSSKEMKFHLLRRVLYLWIIHGNYFTLKLSIDPISPLLFSVCTVVATLSSYFSSLELPHITRSIDEVETADPMLFEIHQFSFISLTARIAYSNMSCRSALLPHTTDSVTILKGECALPMKFIIEELAFIRKHIVQHESTSNHLTVFQPSLENSSVIKL